MERPKGPLTLADAKQMTNNMLNPCNTCDLDPQTCDRQRPIMGGYDAPSRVMCTLKLGEKGAYIIRVEESINGQSKAALESKASTDRLMVL